MESEFVKICRDNGFPTRIVSCSFDLEYDEDTELYQQEYLKLGDFGVEGFDDWLENMKLKNRENNEVILEVLAQVYYKLCSIENLLNKEKQFAPLKNQARVVAIGHDVICLEQKILEPSKKYYARFKSPFFPHRILGFFAQAFDQRILRIVQMQKKDTEDFDMYVANREKQNLRLEHNKKDK